jgi:hypothetical protein
MMISIARATTDTGALELSGAARSFARDMSDMLGAADFVSPAVAVLAERATLALEIALREAAARPLDERWHVAYDALKDFMIFYLRCAPRPDDVPSFVRLSKFLAENSDLSGTSVPLPRRDGRAVTYLFERN